MKVYIVHTDGYRDYDDPYSEIIVFESYGKAKLYMLNKQLEALKKRIENVISVLEDDTRSTWGRRGRYINAKTPREIAERDAFVQSLKNKLEVAKIDLQSLPNTVEANSIPDETYEQGWRVQRRRSAKCGVALQRETTITELTARYLESFDTRYALKVHTVQK